MIEVELLGYLYCWGVNFFVNLVEFGFCFNSFILGWYLFFKDKVIIIKLIIY